MGQKQTFCDESGSHKNFARGYPPFVRFLRQRRIVLTLRMAAEHGEAEMRFARLTSKDGTETAVNLDLVELMKADGTGTRLFFPGSEDGLFVRESTADILEKVSSHVV